MEASLSFFSLLCILIATFSLSDFILRVRGDDPYRFFTWGSSPTVIFIHSASNNRDGLQQRRSSWQDGVYGMNCSIPPGSNFTYVMQAKDQIGSYFYFPFLAFHKAAGGYGGIRNGWRKWTPASREGFNLRDTVALYTVQVYPQSWTAIYMALDNVGMWNVRSENWARQYLRQQFYLRVHSPANSWRDENPIPWNALLCGRASGRRTRPL